MSIAEPQDIPLSLAEPIVKLKRDVKQAAVTMGQAEVRWLVDIYYQLQSDRIRAAAQQRSGGGEPDRLIAWVGDSMGVFERAIGSALGVFAGHYRAGQWLQAQYGIGPVISAGLLSHIDIRKASTVGHIWRFAGLDPTVTWNKKEKRPWNAKLKTLCAFKCGESFVKFQNRDKCYYGKLFAQKKAKLAAQNDTGDFKAAAAAEIARCEASPSLLKRMKTTERWKHWQQGRICPANVHDRARRWTVKLLLSHFHHVLYHDFHGVDPPAPFIFEHPQNGQHVHLLAPPLWPGDYTGKPIRDLFAKE